MISTTWDISPLASVMPQMLGCFLRRSTTSALMEQPVRCEFFDDEIDSMGSFDPGTQRRTANVDTALQLPAAEVPFASAYSQILCMVL